MADTSFEKALAELEDIVAKLEAGGLPLNESLTLFEKGIKQAKFLRQELEKAEKKTEILLKDENGEIKSEPFSVSDERQEEENELSEGGGDDNLPF